jgi:hypothetical protein
MEVVLGEEMEKDQIQNVWRHSNQLQCQGLLEVNSSPPKLKCLWRNINSGYFGNSSNYNYKYFETQT